MANPRILQTEGEITWPEGSPCKPGEEWNVKRAFKLKCRGLDRNGVPFTLKAQNLLSVCVQHEIDHLDGILCFDKSIDPV
jgi:peptide deformylase